MDIDDIVSCERSLDTLERRASTRGFYSSSGSERNHHHHCQHPYRRSEKGYFLEEFNKSKPLAFDGEMMKLEYAEAWLIRMNKFFRLHDY